MHSVAIPDRNRAYLYVALPEYGQSKTKKGEPFGSPFLINQFGITF
jgi:hypothetical protein